ncbi:hypothetical protein [Actinomadura bangladeshensis]|uniref:Uncharacterized protein n=1 Tax=Actinomadura bangladeshensis TaxID=453573 RepID=A0A6L9QVA2_9ACTN|nr:hypothetical protein [Actinomadura bangladeshensis]NEA29470.1 hypothetical protein [Actinomadura bangladeshensis]
MIEHDTSAPAIAVIVFSDLDQGGEYRGKDTLIIGGQCGAAGEEADGVLPIDRRDEIGQYMMQRLGSGHDLRP